MDFATEDVAPVTFSAPADQLDYELSASGGGDDGTVRLTRRWRARFSRHPEPKALHMLPAYEKSLADREAVARAAMPVERIDCPLLLLAGEDYAMWPGARMATHIARRRSRSGAGAHDRVLTFPDAGHFLRPPYTPTTVPRNDSLVSGGTPVGNARAQAKGWAAILAFLAAHLRQEPRAGTTD